MSHDYYDFAMISIDFNYWNHCSLQLILLDLIGEFVGGGLTNLRMGSPLELTASRL